MDKELADEVAGIAARVVASGAISTNGHGNVSVRVPGAEEMYFTAGPSLRGHPASAVVRVGLDGTLLEANQTALEYAGVSQEAVVGRPAWETPWWTAQPPEMQQVQPLTAGVRTAVHARPVQHGREQTVQHPRENRVIGFDHGVHCSCAAPTHTWPRDRATLRARRHKRHRRVMFYRRLLFGP